MPARKKTSTRQARVTRITAFTGGQAKAEKTEAKPVMEAEAKAEVKTEAKVGAKPGEAGSGGTEPKRSSGQKEVGVGFGTIEVPGAVFEGVARELGTATTIVKPLVEWVVNYLNRPCCWSVGLDRLVQDLAKVRGEEVRYSLYVLGFEGGASKVTDEGFALLRRVLLVIIKYLRLAGFVEYIEDLGVVNYVRR
jgi:hypothetical protein